MPKPWRKATVADDGKVTGISLVSPGFGYSSTPAVRIVGGGGAGAVALAILDGSGGVKGIDVKTRGRDYDTCGSDSGDAPPPRVQPTPRCGRWTTARERLAW